MLLQKMSTAGILVLCHMISHNYQIGIPLLTLVKKKNVEFLETATTNYVAHSEKLVSGFRKTRESGFYLIFICEDFFSICLMILRDLQLTNAS